MRPVNPPCPDRRSFVAHCASLAVSVGSSSGAGRAIALGAAGCVAAGARAQGSLDGDTDVPYVITPQAVVDAMLELAAVEKKKRKATRPTRSSQVKRVDSKVKRGQTKSLRGKAHWD